MNRAARVSRPFWAVGLLFALACIDSNGPHQGLNIISGDNQVDTVNSYLTIPLIIQVLNSDHQPNPQHPVRFGANGIVLISPISDPGFVTDGISETTDANGEAAVLLRFKQYAGRDFVQVTDQTSNQFLRAYYTVLPGAPAAVRAQPSDTAVYVGGNVTLRPYITDAYGNRRPDTAAYTYTTLNSALSITTSGKATAVAVGRGAVQVVGLSFADTVWTSVVPQGRIAAIQGPGLVGYIVVTNLDGSSFDTIPNSTIARTIDWSASGDTLAMDAYVTSRLVTMDLAGHTKQVLGTNSISLSEYSPQYSHDGSFIYFAGIDSLTRCYGVWRTHPTGTALEHVVADTITDCPQFLYNEPPGPGYYFSSSPSPDNAQLVYVAHTLRVRTLATGADTSLGVVGAFPRWSPTGEWIAYDSLGTLMLIHPDGTGQVALLDRKDPDAVPGGAPGVAWSPDGQWLLYFGLQPGVFGGLWVVQVGTGLRMPLQFASGLTGQRGTNDKKHGGRRTTQLVRDSLGAGTQVVKHLAFFRTPLLLVLSLIASPLAGQSVADREQIIQLLADSLSGELARVHDGLLPCVRSMTYQEDSSIRAMETDTDSILRLHDPLDLRDTTQLHRLHHHLESRDTTQLHRLLTYSTVNTAALDTMTQQLLGHLGSTLRHTAGHADTTKVVELRIFSLAVDSTSALLGLFYTGSDVKPQGHAFWDGFSYNFQRVNQRWGVTARTALFFADGVLVSSPLRATRSSECSN